jgi:putative Mg2+ transporter-C (MgtC) family protein
VSYVWPIVHLIAAAVLGGVIGAQRQAAHKPAGFRTHLLVAVGSCAFMEVSRLTGDSRIAAGVITGIGFLGAGAIVREGLMTRGLTTAASIWAVSAIGLALGYGTAESYAVAAMTTAIVLAALSFADDRLERIYRPRFEVNAWITFEPRTITSEQVADVFARVCLDVQRSARLELREEDGVALATWLLVLYTSDRDKLRRVALEASELKGIRRVALSEIAPA